MRTLFLNPPSFEGFDGGASSRWPASREIESYWYPVWLCYPAGMLPDSKVVDAPPHKISIEQTVEMAQGLRAAGAVHFDSRLSRRREDRGDDEGRQPEAEGGVRRPAGDRGAGESARSRPAIDFVVRREFDHQIVDYAKGKPLSEICPASAIRKDGKYRPQSRRPAHRESRRAALGHQDLQARSRLHALQRSVPAESVHLVLHLARMPGAVHVLPVAADALRPPLAPALHRRRRRTKCKYALENFPGLKEIFFDDDTFNYQKERTIELCAKLKPLNFTWSCTSRVTTDYDTLKAMKEAGCRLLIVGYESGDPQILKNIKKGATVEMAQRFTENCKKLGLVIHGDFIVGPARRDAARASATPSISPSGWIRRPFRSRSRIPIPAPSSTTTSRRTT